MNQKQNGIYLCDAWDTKQPSRPSVTTQLKVFLKNQNIPNINGLNLLNEETVFLCAATGKGSTAIDYEKFKECESKEIIFGCKMEDSWEIYQVEKGELDQILKKQTSHRQNIARSNCASNKGINSKVFLNKIYPQEDNP